MEKEKVKKVKSIRWTLLAMTLLPMLLVAIVVLFVAKNAVTEGMQSEALDGLKLACTAAEAGYEGMEAGTSWSVKDGKLFKGDINVTDNEALIDSFVEGEDTDITIFYGDTRYASTIKDASGKRPIGTQASAEIANIVLNGKD